MSDLAKGQSELLQSDDIGQLREALARYQRMFNGSAYGFWEWDLAREHLTWAGEFWQWVGYTEGDFERISDPGQVVREYIHPDDREPVMQAIREHLRTGTHLNLSYRLLTKSGDYLWTQARADSKRDERGRVRYISGVNFDITELKQTEARLRESEARQARIIQSANDGIWEWYAERGGFHFSARCWEHIGYSEHDDELNQGVDRLEVWRSRIHPDDLGRFDRVLEEHMSSDEPFDIEYRIRDKGGQIRWIRARGRATLNRQGKAVRMSGTNMDITDIKRAAEQVREARDEAEQASRAKSHFLASMTHELRTPLNAILGYAQIFDRDANLTEQQNQNLRELRASTEYLLQLINDVLDLSKVESGRMALSVESVSVAGVITEVQSIVQTNSREKGVAVQVTGNGLEEASVLADGLRLCQVLVNLVNNGIKYNRRGGEVELALHSPYDQWLRFEVRDTGQGIAEEEQPYIFQPFNRASAEFGPEQGSGVGLAITKQLVKLMNGRIDFVSTPDAGSRFWVDLPLAGGDPPDRSAVPAGVDRAQPAIQVRGRVLYIEDNRSNIRLMEHFFRHYPQLQLEVAEEAFAGLYRARSSGPDLIMLDINLPGMNGLEVLKILRGDPATAHLPVVGLSASAPPPVEEGGQERFAAYLTKPVQLSELSDVLNRCLKR